MSKKAILVFLLLILLFLSSCMSAPSAETTGVSELEKEIMGLRARVATLERQVNMYSSAILDPAETTGYSVMNSGNGHFLVGLEGVQPYLDGCKVSVRIGNPLNIDYKGFTLKAKYGNRLADDFSNAKEHWDSMVEKEFTSTKTLKKGVWNKFDFTLSPLKPEDFGYLEVSVIPDVVTLYDE